MNLLSEHLLDNTGPTTSRTTTSNLNNNNNPTTTTTTSRSSHHLNHQHLITINGTDTSSISNNINNDNNNNNTNQYQPPVLFSPRNSRFSEQQQRDNNHQSPHHNQQQSLITTISEQKEQSTINLKEFSEKKNLKYCVVSRKFLSHLHFTKNYFVTMRNLEMFQTVLNYVDDIENLLWTKTTGGNNTPIKEHLDEEEEEEDWANTLIGGDHEIELKERDNDNVENNVENNTTIMNRQALLYNEKIKCRVSDFAYECIENRFKYITTNLNNQNNNNAVYYSNNKNDKYDNRRGTVWLERRDAIDFGGSYDDGNGYGNNGGGIDRKKSRFGDKLRVRLNEKFKVDKISKTQFVKNICYGVLMSVVIFIILLIVAIPVWLIEGTNEIHKLNTWQNVTTSEGNYTLFNIEKWKYVNCVYFSTVTLTTIGFGDLAPETTAGRLFVIFFSLLGLASMGALIGGLGDKLMQNTKALLSLISSFISGIINFFTNTVVSKSKRSDRVNILQQRIDRIIKHPSVQLFYFFLLFMTYSIIGAAIFCAIENWSFADGLYFTFITLSTIGYGDVELKQTGSKFFLIFFVIYGLGLLGILLALISEIIYYLVTKTYVKSTSQDGGSGNKFLIAESIAQDSVADGGAGDEVLNGVPYKSF
ncbi:hypothetical protein ABK040_011324 [Willaertia magna]